MKGLSHPKINIRSLKVKTQTETPKQTPHVFQMKKHPENHKKLNQKEKFDK